MPHPYPGQDWKHGWIPLNPGATREKNHGRSSKPGGAAAKPEAKSAHQDRPTSPAQSTATRPATRSSRETSAPKTSTKAGAGKAAAPTTSAPATGKDFIDQHYAGWKDSLSPGQEKAMRFYQSPGFALMNGQLRGLDRKDIKADVSFNDADLARASKASKDLNAAIRKAPPLEAPITVYRGFSAEQFGDLKPGMELKDKAFVSTSLTPDVGSVGKAAKPATAEIVLPKGTKAAAGSSRELVLPPGSKFRVASVTSRKGVPHVRLELVL